MLAYLFVLLAIAVRFMPHPWMFTPVAGSLLFFGARGPRRQIWAPVALLIASDLLLNRFVYHYQLVSDQWVIFAWYAAILWLGTRLGRNPKILTLVGSALASSISFFLITNFTSWWIGTLPYPRNLSGILMSYQLGLPFFRHSVEGDLLFTMVMFATPAMLEGFNRAFSRGDHPAAA
ncbi:MAG TPA: DUF6580 family putative transport protein [Terriglobales bacterium]|nr:DUF6580 family putative transport protein [Terriglobales bacterium]HXY14977.1 DUF6580 family putative transport protein [Terriglobales bacterium]